MTYNFDEIIDRKNTNSIKYDFAKERGMPDNVLPLWVADMDFTVPKNVIDTLVNASNHGIFGYSEVKEEYINVLKAWFLKNYKWDIHPSWLVKTPGVVYAICMAIRALTNEHDSVLIQRPVYYPFSESIISNERTLINNPLLYKDGKYTIDLEDFENKIIENNVKLFILCNPHNPVGRVWTREELTAIGDICVKHKVYVVSDEIHADFIYPGKEHIVFSNLTEAYKDITITCTAPSKTFNLAGLQVSNIIIPNKTIKKKFKDEIRKTGYSQLNTMGLLACMAAYKDGEEWLLHLKEYLLSNLSFVREYLVKNIPSITLVEPDGTYLVWLDCNKLNLEEEALEDLIVHKANLWLDKGTMFGPEGSGFQRINIACPRQILEKALQSLKQAVDSLEKN